MREAAKLAARLEVEEPVRFAGLYVEHQPTFRVVVKLVGNADGLLARYTSDPAFVAEKAAVPLRALINKQEAAVRALRGQPGAFLIGVDARTNRVVATVSRGSAHAAKLRTGGLAGSDLAIEEVETVATPAIVYGGRVLKSRTYATNRTGVNYSESASTGFNVRDSGGTRGVTTAAHFDECDVTGINHTDGTAMSLVGCVKNQPATFTEDGTSLTFKSQVYSAGHDVEWRSAADQTKFRNEIQYGGAAAPVTYRITRVGTLGANLPVCKQGITTNMTCGTTGSSMVTYQDPDGIITGSYWMIANNNGSAMAGPGDSGGPVFDANTAYGTNVAVVEGGAFNGRLIAMPVQRFSALGISILIAP
jgi:hypothetical protein